MLLHHGVFALYRKLLRVGFVVDGGLHELVINLHRHVCTRHLALGHLGIDESLAVGMLYAHREHERTAPSVLRHLACGVAETLHKRHKTG